MRSVLSVGRIRSTPSVTLDQTNSAVLHPYMDRLLIVFACVLDPSGPEQVDEGTR
ncbi:hypothetical protein FOMPIDRAFT_94396 [Fomitopsis schrenkii]|uniref:Uncharacterized protein n=1 Tax=Fomitopsis schrenkii TaxID=2126942 RepID=S8DJ25_FOMSC|nr:hypothetical protein FOMPIDRAFT_94396 [Fomitopsis schrenkii]